MTGHMTMHHIQSEQVINEETIVCIHLLYFVTILVGQSYPGGLRKYIEGRAGLAPNTRMCNHMYNISTLTMCELKSMFNTNSLLVVGQVMVVKVMQAVCHCLT